MLLSYLFCLILVVCCWCCSSSCPFVQSWMCQIHQIVLQLLQHVKIWIVAKESLGHNMNVTWYCTLPVVCNSSICKLSPGTDHLLADRAIVTGWDETFAALHMMAVEPIKSQNVHWHPHSRSPLRCVPNEASQVVFWCIYIYISWCTVQEVLGSKPSMMATSGESSNGVTLFYSRWETGREVYLCGYL